MTKNPQKPLVSIGMPIYNGETHVREALDSLLAQSFEDFELIISDNASTDATSSICTEYASRDKRIRYYRNGLTTDAIKNFNRVLELAVGRYFMWAAHDDVREPSFVSGLVNALESNPHAVLASCSFDNLDEDGRDLPAPKVMWSEVFARSRFRQYVCMATFRVNTQKAVHLYGLMRTDALRAIGGATRVPFTHWGEDVLTLLRLLGQGEFVVVDRLLFHYRVHKTAARTNQSVLKYTGYRLRRLYRRIPFHFKHIWRHHLYYAHMRRIIVREAPLALVQKLVLWATLAVLEVSRPISDTPVILWKHWRGLQR